MIRVPDRHFSIFVLANRTDISPDDLAGEILEVFLPQLR
jgi:hypothetical protein